MGKTVKFHKHAENQISSPRFLLSWEKNPSILMCKFSNLLEVRLFFDIKKTRPQCLYKQASKLVFFFWQQKSSAQFLENSVQPLVDEIFEDSSRFVGFASFRGDRENFLLQSTIVNSL